MAGFLAFHRPFSLRQATAYQPPPLNSSYSSHHETRLSQPCASLRAHQLSLINTFRLHLMLIYGKAAWDRILNLLESH